MLENDNKPQNKIQERIEQNKAQSVAEEQQEMADKAERKQKKEQKKAKIKDVVSKVGDTIQTGAGVVSAIPHVATLAIGAGAGGLITKLLQDIKDGKYQWGK